MPMTIARDPANPLGGHAVLVLPPSGPGGPDTTRLKIQRSEDDKFLGPDGWTPNEAELGPFELMPHAEGRAVLLGPAIVGEMEPFQRLTIEAVDMGQTESLGWPEDILPLRQTRRRSGVVSPPGAQSTPAGTTSVVGGIAAGGARPQAPAKTSPPAGQESAPAATATTPTRDQEADEQQAKADPGEAEAKDKDKDKDDGSGEDTTKSDPEAEKGDEGKAVTKDTGTPPPPPPPPQARKGFPLLGVLLLLLLVAAAGGGYYYFTQLDGAQEEETATNEATKKEETEKAEETTKPSEQKETETAAACDLDSVKTAPPETAWPVIQACIAEGKSKETLPLIERLVANEFGPAEFQLAKWMDPEEVSVSPIGASNANSAIRLYDRALKAGVEEAGPLLKRLCGTIDGSLDFATQRTYDKFCKQE